MKRILTQKKPMNGKWMNHNHQGMGWVICMSIFQIYITSLVTNFLVTMTFIIILIKYFSPRTAPDHGISEASKHPDEEPEVDRIQALPGTSQPPQSSQDMGDQLILALK